MLHWAERLEAARQLGALERLMLQAAYGEYLSQLTGGIALSQVEVLRPADLGMSEDEVAALATPAVGRLTTGGNRSEERRVGKSVSVRVDLGGRRIIKKKKQYEQNTPKTIANRN